MFRKFLATALILGLCVAVTGCEKEEATTTGAAGEPAANPDTGEQLNPTGTEGMTIEEPADTGDGQ